MNKDSNAIKRHWKQEDILLMNFRIWVMWHCNWNRSHAAEVLSVDVRTIRNYVYMYRKIGFDIPKSPNRFRKELPDDFWKHLKSWTKFKDMYWLIREETLKKKT